MLVGLLFIIIVTQCDVLLHSTFNEVFFRSLEKGAGVACVNYLKVKNDVTH